METLTLEEGQKQQVSSVIAKTPIFQALKPELIPQLLKVAEAVRYDAGEVILKQGSPSDSFLVVIEGEGAIRIESDTGETELGRIPTPASLGEVGLLLKEPRTASVVATGPLTALRFSAKAFEAMFEKIPNFGEGLAMGLAHRLNQLSGQVPLPGRDLEKEPPSPEALELLPAEFCKRHRVIPLSVDGNVLTLGHVDDPSSQVMSALRELLPSLDVNSVHVDLPAFNEVMRTRSGAEGWAGAEGAPEPAPEADAPRSPRLDALLKQMVGEGASDLHLAAGHKPHWRVDGDMSVIEDAPVLGPNDALELLTPVMEERHRTGFAEDNDADFAYSLPGVARFRVNLFRDHRGTGAVFRQIPSKVLTLEQLGLPSVLKNFCEMPKGLVLVTGPTGSGKSSTLAAMIDFIKKTRQEHIVTIEDPIEFVHESGVSLINQREVGGHTKSFSRALKAALREDPDIILVGELRDLETISLALEAANTGHLVFATLHTNSAIAAVDRIVDMFPGDQQSQVRTALSESLRGVVAQTLVKKADGGRMAVLEILVVNMAASNLIREDKTVQITSIMQANKAAGMSTLNEELGTLIETRKITMEEGLSKAVDKDDLLRRFRSGITLAGDSTRGFRVQVIKPGSPGADAGFQRGDTILEFNGIPGKDHTLDDIRRAFRSDGTHQVTVERGGKRVKLTIELRR